MIRLFNRYWSVAAILSLAVETGILVFSLWLAYQLRFWAYYGVLSDTSPAFYYSGFPLRAGIFAATILLNFYAGGLYEFANRHSIRELAIRVARSMVLATVALLAIYYSTYGFLTVGRGTLALALTISLVLIFGWRFLLRWILRRRVFAERLLIVGTDNNALDLAREVLDRKHLGYRIVGFLNDDPQLQAVSLINPRVIGTTSQVCELALTQQVSRVIVAQRDLRGNLDMDQLLECKNLGVPVETCFDYFERLTGKILIETLRKSWLIFSEGFVVSRTNLVLKRLSDVAVSLVALVLAAPVMVLTALAIKLDSPGPVLFRQERVGLRGEIFTLWKFRSMRVDAEAAEGPQWASLRDPRATRVGRLIRKIRIDELPQLWNVLVGHMSIVGPRPEREPFVRKLAELSPFYEQRLVIRPGLTGWAQIRAPYAASFEDSLKKLMYDLYYVKNLSFLLDVSILASTARIVLLGRLGR